MAGIVMASPAFGATTFKNDQEKVSYMIGYQIGSNFKRDGLEVDLTVLTSGLKAALAGEKSPLTPEESQKLMTDLQKNLQAKAEAKQKAELEEQRKIAEQERIQQEAKAKREKVEVWFSKNNDEIIAKFEQESFGKQESFFYMMRAFDIIKEVMSK